MPATKSAEDAIDGADTRFLAECLRQATGAISIDVKAVAEALGYKNSGSVANRIALLRRKYKIPVHATLNRDAAKSRAAAVAEATTAASIGFLPSSPPFDSGVDIESAPATPTPMPTTMNAKKGKMTTASGSGVLGTAKVTKPKPRGRKIQKIRATPRGGGGESKGTEMGKAEKAKVYDSDETILDGDEEKVVVKNEAIDDDDTI
ncbi:MAG: hypothetical protein M1834_005767 [Cirrosporium novae-zelandiae]|nr:MAG: hypothetical protein M1834_005767 [Cirrosporium novae-zelandiae]